MPLTRSNSRRAHVDRQRLRVIFSVSLKRNAPLFGSKAKKISVNAQNLQGLGLSPKHQPDVVLQYRPLTGDG